MTEVSPAPAASCPTRPFTAEIDASTRIPVLLMAVCSVKWLLISLVAGLISTMKVHMPSLLSGWPIFTYGRLVALQDAVFIYGFASQAAMAVGIWLICRLGAVKLIGRGAMTVAALGWNFGVLAGFGAILFGNIMPFEHLQFPQSVMSILLLSYLLYAASAITTFAHRNECTMYPSLWFILAGLVFFPWVYATAMMTMWSSAVRPSVLPIIAGWAANNIAAIWLGSVALAALYYFLPKLCSRPLYSSALAAFAYWLYVIFGQATGMHYSAAVPSWVQGLSEICTLILLLPVAATAVNWRQTLNTPGACKDLTFPGRFTSIASKLFVVSAVVAALGALAPFNRLLQFTIFQTGLSHLFLLGFVTLSFLGAFSYILPRAAELEWPRPPVWHYRLSVWGAIFIFAPLIIGGFIQASRNGNVQTDYLAVARSTIPFLGIAIIGYLFMIAGQCAFLLNFAGLLCGACCPSRDNGGKR